MLDTTVAARVQAFLDKFEAALAAADLDSAVAMFAPECYWRDLVAFTWNIKTMEGRDQIRDMLGSCLAHVKPRHWTIAEGETPTEADGVTESWISFETELARGYGLIRLQNGQIWTLLTTIQPLPHSFGDRFGPICHAELLEDAGPVGPNRAFAYA